MLVIVCDLCLIAIVRDLGCDRALHRQIHCSDDLFFGAHRNTVLAFLSRASFSAHANDTHLFIALYNHWIEKTAGIKMTKDFSRQVLVSSYCSTARVNTCDALQRFPLSHCTCEHVVCLELRRECQKCLFTTTRLCGEPLTRLATQHGHQSSCRQRDVV